LSSLDDSGPSFCNEDELMEFFFGKIPRFVEIDSKDTQDIILIGDGRVNHHPDSFCPRLFGVLSTGIIQDVPDDKNSVLPAEIRNDFLTEGRALGEVLITQTIYHPQIELVGLRV
jgi:hypothetical protein